MYSVLSIETVKYLLNSRDCLKLYSLSDFGGPMQQTIAFTLVHLHAMGINSYGDFTVCLLHYSYELFSFEIL